MNLNIYLSYADWYRVKKGNYYSYFGTGPDSALSSVRAFVAEMGFALPMRHSCPRFCLRKCLRAGNVWPVFQTGCRSSPAQKRLTAGLTGVEQLMGCPPPPPDASAFSAGERKTRASSPLRYALQSPSPKRFLCILLRRHPEIARSTSSPMMSISRVVRCTPVEM